MSTRTRFTLACLAGVTVMAAAACVPPPAAVAPTTSTTSTTTTSTTTTSTTTVAEVDPNDWVGQCYDAAYFGYTGIRVDSVLLDDGDHWVASFSTYFTSDCSGTLDGIGTMAFGADEAEGEAACSAYFGFTDGGTMADWWNTSMPVEARICLPGHM